MRIAADNITFSLPSGTVHVTPAGIEVRAAWNKERILLVIPSPKVVTILPDEDLSGVVELLATALNERTSKEHSSQYAIRKLKAALRRYDCNRGVWKSFGQ